MFSKQDLNWFFKHRAAVLSLMGNAYARADRSDKGQSTADDTNAPGQQPATQSTYYNRNKALCQAKSRLYYWTNRETRLTYQRKKRKNDSCLTADKICDKGGYVDE